VSISGIVDTILASTLREDYPIIARPSRRTSADLRGNDGRIPSIAMPPSPSGGSLAAAMRLGRPPGAPGAAPAPGTGCRPPPDPAPPAGAVRTQGVFAAGMIEQMRAADGFVWCVHPGGAENFGGPGAGNWVRQ
jgi:hypothetical protein